MLGPGLQGQKRESEGRLDKTFLLGFVGTKEPVRFQTESKIVRFDHNCLSGEHTKKDRDSSRDGRTCCSSEALFVFNILFFSLICIHFLNS